jgi:hypothetical protein
MNGWASYHMLEQMVRQTVQQATRIRERLQAKGHDSGSDAVTRHLLLATGNAEARKFCEYFYGDCKSLL